MRAELLPLARGSHRRDDDFIVAVATDSPERLPEPTGLPVLDLNDADALAQWLIDNQVRFAYNAELFR